MTIQKFRVEVPQEEVDFLKSKLKLTRLSPSIEDANWQWGISSKFAAELKGLWLNQFDWRSWEKKINSFQNFTTEIDGQRIHFIHERSPNPDAVPLLLVHGWPGSFMEFLELIEPLKNGSPAFHVIVPSLPGYGFSSRSMTGATNTNDIADIFVKLMSELGYDKFYAQGGDWGSGIVSQIGRAHPSRCFGVHVNLTGPFPEDNDMSLIDASESGWLADNVATYTEGMGYFGIQSTRPQTLAQALSDSPIGLACWIGEKFVVWSDKDADGSSFVSTDTILAHASLYWFTQSIGSSIRLYYDEVHKPGSRDYLSVPTGIAVFPREILKSPRKWAEKHYNIRQWSVMPRGGHFAALEVPDLLIEDIRSFVKSVV